MHRDYRVAGGVRALFDVSGRQVAPGYFSVMGIPIMRGREFDLTDLSYSQTPAAGQVPVIIGSALARRLWPGADPIGRQLRPVADSLPSTGDSRGRARTLTVVGVVDEAAAAAAAERDMAEGERVYLPSAPTLTVGFPGILIRTAGLPEALIPTIRTAALEELPGMAIREIRTVADIEAEERNAFYLVTASLAGGGLLALFLSAIGLYAVVAFAVGQRTGEVAVRMAFGARAGQVVGRFVADGCRLGVFGLVVGLPLSLLSLRMLMAVPNFLPTVALSQVTTVAIFGVLAVAAAASLIPARHAAAVDPAVTLRGD